MTTSFSHDNRDLAVAYDRLSDSQFESGKRLVERLGIGAGARVLDVGCGTGRLARWIADIVGPTGSVVGVDPLPERIAIARSHAPAIAFEVGQAEDLSAFAEGSFDAVCMSAVFHWVSDKSKALSEVRRVLQLGGRLGVTTLPADLTGAGTISRVLRPLLERAPYAECVDLSAMPIVSRGSTASDLIAMVLASGLEFTEMHIVPRSWKRTDGAEVVDFLEASSFGHFLRIVPDELRASLREDLVASFDARKRPDGIAINDWGAMFVATRR